MNMDLKTIYETNFTIFIGIFVTLAVMGTTTLYDKYKSKGGASFDLGEFKCFSGLNQKIATFSSGALKQFSEQSKKLNSLIPKKSGQIQKKSSSVRKTSSKNGLEKGETIFLKLKNTVPNILSNLSRRLSSLSSTLPRRSKNDEGKSVSRSNSKNMDSGTYKADKVNNLDKVIESKKDELDFDDDLLTKMSTANTLKSIGPEAGVAESSFNGTSSELDSSFDNDLNFDGSEFDIKVEGLNNEPSESSLAFNEGTPEIKFGEESDSLLASLKKDIVVVNEKKINFMDSLQEEDLDIKLMKTDLEGVLKDLKRYRQYSNSH
jgi:hypothetical protein